MAEIRKHKSSSSSPITRALEAALGASVRPVTPGAPPQPNSPGTGQRPTQPTIATVAATKPGAGWVSIKPEQAPKVERHAAEDDELN